MELEWRNRCVGGERLADLSKVVLDLGASDPDELFDLIWDDPHDALPFHRALLRVQAELLWQRAAGLRPTDVGWMDDTPLATEAYHELLERAGLELGRTPSVGSRGRDDDADGGSTEQVL